MSNDRRDANARVRGATGLVGIPIPRRAVLAMPLLASPLMLTGCGTETLLSASFNQDPTALPPAFQQTVGTALVLAGTGRVEVTVSPIGEADQHWALIQHPEFNDVTALRCRFNALGGVGQFTCSTRLYIPAGARGGTPTVSFESFNQGLGDLQSFLHLDFLENGEVRVNDDGNLIAGTYQRAQLISILVALTIADTSATARLRWRSIQVLAAATIGA